MKLIAQQHIDFYGLDLSRISSIFILQTLKLGFSKIINTHQMLQQVKYLEGLYPASSMKRPERFKNAPLKGLYKAHFMDARFLLRNLGAHFGLDHDGNRKLDTLIKRAFAKNTSGYVDDDFIKYIAHHFTVAAFQERSASRNNTGEWVVFQKYQNKNYYLTLASHDEADELIYKRVLDAYDMDFSFLRKP